MSASIDKRILIATSAFAFLIAAHLILITAFRDADMFLLLEDAPFVMSSAIAAFCFFYAFKRSTGRVRAAWLAIFVAMIFNTSGELAWLVLEVFLRRDPFPSAADIGYLAFYPFFAAGIFLFPSVPRSANERARLLLDECIGMISSLLILWIYIIPELYEEDPVATFVSIAYVLMDLLLVIALMDILFREHEAAEDWPSFILILGMGAMIITDLGYAYQEIQGTYTSGSLLDTGWLAAYMLIGIAPLLSVHPPSWRPINIKRISYYVPVIWLGIALILVLIREHESVSNAGALVASISGIIGLMLLREKQSLRTMHDMLKNLREEAERRAAMEKSLAESKNLLESILSQAQCGILVVDADRKILFINDAARRILRKRPGGSLELRSHNSEDEPEWNLCISRALRGAITESKEERVVVDGESFDLLLNSAPLKDSSGGIVGAVVSFMDISDRKRLEDELRRYTTELERMVEDRTREIERKNAEMERFVYTVSHDLRSPLITILGFIGYLREDLRSGQTDKVESDIRFIENSVLKMDRLLTNTLELSRIGRVISPPEDVYFSDIVREVLSDMNAKLRGVDIIVADDMPSVHVDRMRIGEMLANLIDNSIKYTANTDHPRIEIGWRPEDAAFFVKDNGIGIDPKYHDKVFDLFYRIDRSTPGTGAGLAIVKKIVEVHGGRIWIESEGGKGCTVCFTLPLSRKSNSEESQSPFGDLYR
ncbi:sensor histidine kinase [Methanothrix thermoacetophila]|uniref:histidine kinase n=1 Tax=Methanothrix thermoacetophila (strain DSM 6194 / JCM 14653 / NBRC 101360 / PT) TaxID=349307 RepID=A0B6U7_METTP|nr:ATP-binding protein [Methanothrix thermoacetophila]ABK14421.1 multi-sensor signal transduction histidine kinase [Methanothrix thermoacetophila PT]